MGPPSKAWRPGKEFISCDQLEPVQPAEPPIFLTASDLELWPWEVEPRTPGTMNQCRQGTSIEQEEHWKPGLKDQECSTQTLAKRTETNVKYNQWIGFKF